ncbi:MAG TPA: RNA methyltransferase [Thermodesulfovibrionales bacterium]|nr:RNA methyltransferase [Thermodesulfovibrionales bacterium]
MTYRKITSISNPIIKGALKVKERKACRPEDFLIEGQHLLEMAVAANTEVRQIFLTARYRSKNEGFLREVERQGWDFIETTDHILSKLSDTETPQGIVAVVSYSVGGLRAVSLKDQPLIIVCDGIQDPGNLGTIIRTSDAAGAGAVILLPGTCDAFSPKVIRASAGSVFNIPVLSVDVGILIKWLHEKGIMIVVTDARMPMTIYESDLRKPLAFVFGNEAKGVSECLKGHGDLFLGIPILGKAESLNVAASAAICLFETVRQRRSQP